MGICLAIAAIAMAATAAADIGFTIAEGKKQEELKKDISIAQSKIDEANKFYQTVYNVVKARLCHLKQSLQKLPHDVVKSLEKELQEDMPGNPSQFVQALGKALGIDQLICNLTSLTAELLTTSGLAAAEGIIAELGEVAGAAGSVFAVIGFGFTLYNGIKAMEELNAAIEKVKSTQKKAENVMEKMKKSLDSLISSLGLKIQSYDTLISVSNDWAKLAENFDKYSTAFSTAMQGFAMGKTQKEINAHLRESHNCLQLKDDVLVLAKVIEEDILQMMRQGKTDEQIISFYLTEHPRKGLHFQLEAYFLSTLRSFV